jgi:hypothetical protein
MGKVYCARPFFIYVHRPHYSQIGEPEDLSVRIQAKSVFVNLFANNPSLGRDCLPRQ